MADPKSAPFVVPAVEAEVKLATDIISKIDRRYSPVFTRAGDQQYSELDSAKDPFTDAVDGDLVQGRDYFLFTDGKFEWTATIRDTSKKSQAHFRISDYNYVVKQTIVRDSKGKVQTMHQAVTCKNYRIKALCQHMLGIPLS